MANEDARKLFVAGLPDSVTEEDLRALFQESGSQVVELTLPRDRMSGRPRGFAFVRLGGSEDADRARSLLDGRLVDGKSISVRPFQAEPPTRGERPVGGDRPPRDDRGPMGPRPDRGPREGGGFGGGGGGGTAPDRTLYVGNLPYDATPEEVETLLRELGAEPVLRVHLPVDQDGRKRGFGFVTLGSAEVARNAIDQLKGAELRSRRLIVNLANPKGAPGTGPTGGPGGPPGDRPPRSFGPPGGGPGGGPGFGGPPPGSNFGPPAVAGANKGTDRRKKKFDGPGGEGADGRGKTARREREERWRDQDDDE